MATTIQKTFRLPIDLAERLSQKENATEYVVSALREKFKRDEDEAFAASLQCLVGDDELERFTRTSTLSRGRRWRELTIEQGFVFWCDFGPHSSHLQEGRRPALIVQSDILNRIEGLSTFIVVPSTTKQRRAQTFIQIEPSASNTLTATGWAITNQIYTVAESDRRENLGRISRTELFLVKEALKKVLALS